VPSSLNVSAFSKIPVPDSSQKCGKSAATASALLVSNIKEDHRFLEEIFFQKQWMLFRTGSVADALSVVGRNEISVVISERNAPGGGWKNILSALERFPRPPLLVVTSRLPDDHLWAEALNLGAHDVLATPFSAKELVWVLENAWHRFGSFGAEKPRTFAAGSTSVPSAESRSASSRPHD
jgi:DNA-binding response OmpR family regulator